MPPGQKLVQGIAAGSLASEAISAHKAHKQKRKEAEARSSASSQVDAQAEALAEAGTEQRLAAEQLEQERKLDEAQDELHPHNDAGTHKRACHENVNDNSTDLSLWAPCFASEYSPSLSDAPKLPYPVILPQRRPENNKHGFIRAYRPVLEDFGIDQETFLDFLETSNKACQATPWLYALNLASIGTIWLPGVISFVVSALIQVGTEAASRWRADAKRMHTSIKSMRKNFDLTTTISTAIYQGGPGTLNKLKHKLKSSHGKTQNELPFPESAPLTFPDLDAVAAFGSEAKIKSLKKREFLADYFDRRGQAKFTMENPTSALNMAPKPTFTSRYADPSHPASSGDLLSLVSGGHITRSGIHPRAPESRRAIASGRFVNIPGGNVGLRDLPGGGIVHAVMAARQRGRGGNDLETYNEDQHTGCDGLETGILVNQPDEAQPYGDYARRPREYEHGRGSGERRPGGLVGGVKKLLKRNVLYLMIVNMPSEEEMVAARAMFD